MKLIPTVFSLVLLLCSLSSSVHAQGAALSGVREAAENLAQDVQDDQKSITAGPADKQEKVAPGKIDADASQKFTKTSSGLKYRILRQSTKSKPKASNSVVAHYKGWLDDKRIFDSSYRRGEPTAFPLRRVIPGWTEGLQLIGEGGMIELDIPYQLGYGAGGHPGAGIPARARLHFVVELVSIK